ncbi:hypothetical protein [Fluoribacter dumoffii]|uniref:hypothetical protein n=1 Tax=Fluoribacter dumoffii TaxID=463 RepID=UPI00026C7A76|nr:hypothetical protein [Fluoribacter dumoffii]
MILKSAQEKREFLEECLSHIDHLFKHVARCKNLQNISLSKKIANKFPQSNNLADSELPSAITVNGSLPDKNSALGKLVVLTSLYNHVALQMEQGINIDLEIEFNRVKQKLHFTLLNMGLPGADNLMKEYRHHFLGEGILGYILNFIWMPASSEFLNKYEFFTKKTDSEDNINFRYELAESCQFDVNLISKIEPIGMGLGYIIEAKSTQEASIIMDAIRKRLSEEKIEDSIRFLPAQSRSCHEDSSTIEIWGPAVDMLNTMKRKYIKYDAN